MHSSDRLRQIRWRCHRGMLELDMIFMPFFDLFFETLSELEQQCFVDLLQKPDPVLLAWCLDPKKSEPTFRQLVENMIAANKTMLVFQTET